MNKIIKPNNMKYHSLLEIISFKKNVNFKLFTFILTLLFCTSASYAQGKLSDTFITAEFNNATLTEVIRKIENNTDFKFVYQSEMIAFKDQNLKFTLKNKKWSIGEILAKVGNLADVSFRQVNNNITIKDNEIENYKSPGKPINVSGIVTDNEGTPLLGVNILEVGTLNGVTTGFDGEYIITASNNSTLDFSYLGFISKRINIENKEIIDVQLAPNTTTLSQIVITGYQTLSTERTTGSFGSIKEVQIQNQVEENLTARLNGLTTGLVVDKNADGTDQVIIRGQSTFASDRQPLIVVDGLPIEGGWETIEPNDVKSISVLKDASAASIWGTRASNGVIIIETKSADKTLGKSQVSVNFTTTIGDQYDISDLQLANSSDLVDFETYANLKGAISMINLARTHFAISPVTQLFIDNPPNLFDQLNALKQLNHTSQIEANLMRKSILYQGNIFVQTTTERNSFSVSLNGKSNQTNLEGTGNKQFSLNLKNSFSIANDLDFDIGVSTRFTENKFNGISSGSISGRKPYELLLDNSGNTLPQSYTWHQQYINQFQDDGYLNWDYNLINEVNGSDNSSSSANTRFNASLKYEPIKGLDLTASFLYETGNRKNRNLQTEDVYSTRNMINKYTLIDDNTGLLDLQYPRGGILSETTNPYDSYTIRALASYKRSFLEDDKLRMNVLGGYEVREFNQSSNRNTYGGYDDQGQQYSQIYLQGFVEQFDGDTSESFPSNMFESQFSWEKDRHLSYFGNFNLTYKNRYTLTGSGRVDKASLFGVDERFKNNPLWSIGGKWNIAQEDFNPEIFDRLEFRVSYGFTGNINKDFTSFATATYEKNQITQVPYLQLQTPKNDDLSFERTGIFNVGIDFALKDNIIGGSIEYFTKNSTDLLGQFPNDPTTGWPYINSNYANMDNYGIEVDLNSVMIKTDDIQWSAGIKFSYVHNEVTSVVNALTDARYYIYGGNGAAKEGYPISAMYNFQYVGLNTYGNYMYSAANGEVYTGRETDSMGFEDLLYSGQTTPKFYGGFDTSVSYKDFSLDVLVTYKGGYISRMPMIDYNSAAYTGNTHESIANIWIQPGDESKEGILPAYYDGQTDVINSLDQGWRNNAFANDQRYFDASHIRFKNVRLSYRTPFGKNDQFNINVFVLAQNLAVFTKNKLDIDPDFINPYTGALRFTEPRSYALGFNLTL